MPTTTRQVREALLARLATVEGLTVASQVKGGKYEQPPGTVPFACLWTVQIDEEAGPPLTHLQQQGTFMAKVWVKGNTKDPSNRQAAAEDMLDAVRTALRADRLLGGLLVLPVRASGAPFDDAAPQSIDKQPYGVVVLAITATWRE